MRNEAAVEATISTWIKDAKRMIQRFHITTEDAMDTLEIPQQYRETVLKGL